MDIGIIGVPLKYGCGKEGVEDGPSKLRASNISKIISSDKNTASDLGDIYVPSLPWEDAYRDHNSMRFLNTIKDVNEELAEKVYRTLKKGTFPFILGGDHSLALGSIAGSSKFFKKLAVIWIDAHGDINNVESSPTGNIHGMPLAISMGLGHPSLTNIFFPGPKILPSDTYIIGARDLDPGEVETIKRKKVNLYTMSNIKESGLKNTLKTVVEKIKSTDVDGVHLSFDIDAMDKSITPGTGTPVKGGFTLEEARIIIETIFQPNFITSMDFAEFNPRIDENNRTLELSKKLIGFVAESL